MADNITTRISLDDVRASVKRIRDRGEKLVDRIRTDAKDLLANAPNVVSIEEARSRRDEIVTDLVALAIKALGLAKAEQVTKLEARLSDLERRLEAVAKREIAA
jgi:hypothetical protein